MFTFPARLAPLAGLAAAASAAAQPVAPPSGVVSLESSATVEAPKDMLSVTLATVRDGADAGSVQSQLKQALDAALAEANKGARPGQVEVRTGNFTIFPRYNNKGASIGWQGSTELVIEGRDMQAIGQLTGRITTLAIGGVVYSLSRELRDKSEAEVAAQAIARFRAKAADYARQFGYAGYTLREVNVQTGEAPPGMPMPLARMKAMGAAADESLPVEPGKGAVTVSVSGTVQMNK